MDPKAKQMTSAKRLKQSLELLNKAAQLQQMSVLPLIDDEGNRINIYAIGKRADIEALQELLLTEEPKND